MSSWRSRKHNVEGDLLIRKPSPIFVFGVSVGALGEALTLMLKGLGVEGATEMDTSCCTCEVDTHVVVTRGEVGMRRELQRVDDMIVDFAAIQLMQPARSSVSLAGKLDTTIDARTKERGQQ